VPALGTLLAAVLPFLAPILVGMVAGALVLLLVLAWQRLRAAL